MVMAAGMPGEGAAHIRRSKFTCAEGPPGACVEYRDSSRLGACRLALPHLCQPECGFGACTRPEFSEKRKQAMTALVNAGLGAFKRPQCAWCCLDFAVLKGCFYSVGSPWIYSVLLAPRVSLC